jgi:hypothetical protein
VNQKLNKPLEMYRQIRTDEQKTQTIEQLKRRQQQQIEEQRQQQADKQKTQTIEQLKQQQQENKQAPDSPKK